MARKPKTVHDEVVEKPAKPAKTKTAKSAKPEPVEVAADSDTDGSPPKTSRNVVDTSRYVYATSDVPTASGRKSKDSGDPVAAALRGKTVEQLFAIVTENGMEVKDNWYAKNPGLARMAAGNALRGQFRRTGSLIVEGATIAAVAA